ncbi:type III pantothenate kinase [Thalassotalea marina]|uniref:Type III pantothenate kinase n=1 Tax=Thalassotalea marina TaxID=1673741 RepID=A0A919EJS8_9GAMM|nr:type III pantothenate kinase [Thalassotalea marina]GHF86951.1 type III pantothenate kinase [Thalassotalea marina]
MKLLIDVGNTRIKYAFDNKGQLSEVKYLEKDDLHYLLTQEVLCQIKKVIIAAVGQSIMVEQLVSLFNDVKVPVQMLKSQPSFNGLVNSYAEPEKLGVDRWLAMLGAKHSFTNKHLLVIDAGTATTVDFINAEGVHQGGWILPGLQLMRNALYGKTEKVKGDEQAIQSLMFANNTTLAVNQGVHAATIGGIKQAINLATGFAAEQGGELVIVLTGGDAQQIQSLLSVKSRLINALIFIGMQQYC